MRRSLVVYFCPAILLAAIEVACQPDLISSFPHYYPGLPNAKGDFSNSRAWQNYFHVKDQLPNITFPVGNSYAGNIPVNRAGHPNNTLFFWAFEKEYGSLTSKDTEEPWVLWLNGGPGASSMLGLTIENGPIHFDVNGNTISNEYSWDKAADTFWIDQPVGVGYATSDLDALAVDEEQVGADFFGFLDNLVQVFPSLAKRPLHLTGESYSGIYIPYIMKTYFSMHKPPVSIRKIAMGDGAYGSDFTDKYPGVVPVIETFPQLINFDTEVLEYFKEQSHLCGFDVNLTYPQDGIIPTIVATLGPAYQDIGELSRTRLRTFTRFARDALSLTARNERTAPHAWKRDLIGLPTGTINPWYGCDLLDELIDYALNFTLPWKGNADGDFDVYDVPDALSPEAGPNPITVGAWLNDPRVVYAIHAPTSKSWAWEFTEEYGYPFGGSDKGGPPAMNFFSELASNLSAHGIPWILYSGNDDSLIPHFGTEIVIQNTTFGGIRGFTQPPSTPWYDGAGNFLGKIHQERNLTYALFANAGHQVPEFQPAASFLFLKEFILGDNPLGTVLPNGTTVGGTNSSLASHILSGEHDPIFFGSGVTEGSTFFDSATIAAWDSYTATMDVTTTSSPAVVSTTSASD